MQKKYFAKYYAKNKDKLKAQQMAWRDTNSEKFKEQQKRSREKIRDTVLTFLGGVCAECGFSDKRALQIDHINDNGAKERREFKSFWSRLKLVLADPTNYQILCANHNMIKEMNRRKNK